MLRSLFSSYDAYQTYILLVLKKKKKKGKDNLVPSRLFEKRSVNGLLKDFSPKVGTYYKAILQNLFFGTSIRRLRNADFASLMAIEGRPIYTATPICLKMRVNLRICSTASHSLTAVCSTVWTKFVESEEKSNVRQDDFSEEKKTVYAFLMNCSSGNPVDLRMFTTREL